MKEPLCVPELSENNVNSLEITTMIGCPVMCTVCPQTPLKNNYESDAKYMSLDNFKTALSTVPRDTLINFAGYSEPFANPKCLDMIEYALTEGYAVGLYTTLYKVDKQIALRLIELKQKFNRAFCRFFVHLPDASGNMRGLKMSVDYLEILTLIDQEINPVYMTMDENNMPHEDITSAGIRAVPWIFHTRAGTLEEDNPIVDKKDWKNEFIIECTKSKDLRTGVLLPNGDVALCCMDFGLKHIIGNLLTQTYNEVQTGKPLTEIKQSNNTIGFHTNVLCRTCQDAHDRTPWNDEEVYEMVKLIDPDSLGL